MPERAPQLLEREAESRRLTDILARARAGEGSTIAIVGPAGIGKTSLLTCLIATGKEEGFSILSARGGEREQQHAFGVTTQLLSAAPEEVPAADSELPLRVMHRLYWEVMSRAAATPLLIVVDDVFWADAASLRWLHYLARRVDGSRVLLALGSREQEPGALADEVAALLGDPAVERIRLEPLAQGSCGVLVGQTAGIELSSSAAEACHVATGGVPFLLRELARELGADPPANAQALEAHVRELGPATIGEAAVLRLSRLGEAATRIAQAVTILGADATLARVTSLASVSVGQAAPIIDALHAADILAGLEPLEFIHPIVGTAIHASLGATDRAMLQREAARMLADAGLVEHAASHLLEAPGLGEVWAAEALRRAAASVLARGAPDAAARYLQRALTEQPTGPARIEIEVELGRALRLAGSPDARRHLERAVTESDGDRRAEAVAELVWLLVPEGRYADAVELLRAEACDRTHPLNAMLGLLEVIDLGGARTAQPTGSSATELAARAWHGMWTASPALDVARDAERALAATSERFDDPAVWAPVVALIATGRYATAEAVFERGLARASAEGSVVGFVTASTLRAYLRLSQGRLLEAEEDAETGLDAVRAAGLPEGTQIGYLSAVRALRGRAREAFADLETLGLLGPLERGLFTQTVLDARASVNAALGNAEHALADLLELGTWLRDWELVAPGLHWRARAVPLLIAAGRATEAHGLAEQELEIAGRWGTPRALGIAHHAAGVATGRLESLESAVDHLRTAAAPLELCSALTSLGTAIRLARRPADARGPLREAVEIAHVTGATLLETRALEELHAAGGRPRRVALSGVEALTPSERRVARLAAAGKTNLEIARTLFVTPKTVERHLTNVYAKLGVTSRAQLPAAIVA